MSASFPMGVNEYLRLVDVICSIPAGGAGEVMQFRGNVYGRGSTRIFSGGLVGKTLILTDAQATSTAQKEIKFTSAHFANPSSPTLAEIVTAINATLALDATPTVASAGAQGELVLTGAAASATASLILGGGTANILLGFPRDGVTVRALNGTGVSITLPSGVQAEYLYSRSPEVDVYTYTVATAVRTRETTFSAVWTPSTRVLLVSNNGGAARVAHIHFKI